MSKITAMKTAISVTAMADMVGLSRTRFYQLVKRGTFPEPDYAASGRPFYSEDKQRVALQVKARNCGVDGRPVIFNSTSRRSRKPSAPRRARGATKSLPQAATLVRGLAALGLQVPADQLGPVLEELFPQGAMDLPIEDVLRAVFLHLRQRSSSSA